jgi:hypothetical protein
MIILIVGEDYKLLKILIMVLYRCCYVLPFGSDIHLSSLFFSTVCLYVSLSLSLSLSGATAQRAPGPPQGGRTRTDKTGVCAGDDIGSTDISCNFMARQYTRPTRQSYRNDHRHVGVMRATPSINTPDWCAEQVRTRLPCDLTLFCSADTDFVGMCVCVYALIPEVSGSHTMTNHRR